MPGGKHMLGMSKNRVFGTAKVGDRGQIVIPQEARRFFGISPGDTLLILADAQRGIALERYQVFEQIAESIFQGRGRDIYPDHSESESRAFAQAIRQLSTPEEPEER